MFVGMFSVMLPPAFPPATNAKVPDMLSDKNDWSDAGLDLGLSIAISEIKSASDDVTGGGIIETKCNICLDCG